ncbi:unnamed protein product [Musa textilis]
MEETKHETFHSTTVVSCSWNSTTDLHRFVKLGSFVLIGLLCRWVTRLLSPRSSFHLMGAFGGRSLGCPQASSLPRSSSRRVVIIPLLEPEGWLSLSGRSLPLKKIWSAVIIGWLPTKNSKLGSGGGPGARTVGTSRVKSQENEMRGLIGGAGGAVPPPQALW